MSQLEDAPKNNVVRTYRSPSVGRSEDSPAISHDLRNTKVLVDVTGENAGLLKERRKLFRWLDAFENRWLGVDNRYMVKRWLQQEDQQCLLCRKLADDLSQIVRNPYISNALGVLFSVGNLVYAVFLGYFMRRLETVSPGESGAAVSSLFGMICIVITFALIFSGLNLYDSGRRSRLAFELMKFSNSVPAECDVPCAMHRISCGDQDTPTTEDGSNEEHDGQKS